jgi:hypothetical protein
MKMAAREVIGQTRNYLNYLERHIDNVEKAFREFEKAMDGTYHIGDDGAYWSLRMAVVQHDLSKFGPFEFSQYREFFYPVGDKPRPPLDAFKHHYDSNDHHWQHWTKLDRGQYICCAHMVIDWLAMSYEFGDTPRAYYEKNKDRIKIPEWAVTFIYEIFDKLESKSKTGKCK